jgi:hypothetical protein
MGNLSCLVILSIGLLESSTVAPQRLIDDVVSLQIQIAGQKTPKRVDGIPYHKGMTVLELMEYTKQKKKVTFTYRGNQSTAFLMSIDGVKNKGARGDNWIFRVNNNLGKKSFGVTKLKAGDEVTWTYGKYKPSPSSN